MASTNKMAGPNLSEASLVNYQDEAALTQFLNAMAAAFERVALTITFLVEMDSTPPPYPSPSIDRARIRRHISRIEEMAKDGAILLEAGQMSALAVWEPPDFKGKPFSENTAQPGPLREYFRDSLRLAKEKHIGTIRTPDGKPQLRPFYHLGFLGRNPDKPSVPGAISAVVRPVLERARREGVPAWLEATDQHAVAVYQHFGFRLVETIMVGVGQRNAQGWPEDGGTGVPGFAMLYDDHLQK